MKDLINWKGTKGGWSVGKTKHSNKEFKGGHIYVDAKTHNQMIEVNFSPYSQIEALANAKLIAAAPDMLKALIEIYNDLDSCIYLTPKVLNNAKKAINKALNQ